MGRIVLSKYTWGGASLACMAAGMLVEASQLGEVTTGYSSLLSSSFLMAGIVIALLFGVLSLVRRDKAPAGYKLPPVYHAPIPVIGNFLGFAKSPLGFVNEARKACGDVFTIDMIAEKCTFMIGADAHAGFFEATDEELDQAPVYSFMKPIFGTGIIYDSPLKKRRQQMRALGTCLRPSILKTYPEIIAKETKQYLEKHWKEEGVVEIHKTFAELIIMTASSTLLGPELRGEMFDEMSELYELLDKGLTPLSIFFPNAPTAAHKKRDEARVAISELFSKVLNKRRDDPENSTSRNDMIQKLLEFKYSDGSTLSDDEIAGMILATLFAGQHTSSIVSTWSLLYLLEDKRKGGPWMDKVLDEIVSLEPQPGAFAEAQGLDGSTVQREEELYKVVKEAIRLQPPLIMLMRRVVKPITLKDGTYIPVGHRAMVSNAIAQRLPEVFENPDEFDPARWEDFNIAKLPKYSFIGFGAGIHTCMGESFAFLQVRTILTVLLSMYEVELTTPFPEPDYTAMVVPPKGPNLVRFKRRKTPLATGRKVQARKTVVPKPVVSGPADDSGDNKTTFTRAEVARHNTKESLWIIVRGKVYDVTTYLSLHQGGDEAILRWGGKDATEGVEGPQHPGTVATLIKRYEIGTLVD